MKKCLFLLWVCCCAACNNRISLPDGFTEENRNVQVNNGKIICLSVHSPQLHREVKVDIWLPPTYSKKGKASPVLYMHDGQNIFDYNVTWNHQTWNIDSVLYTLKDSFLLPVVVGLYSEDLSRYVDYLPDNYITTLQALRTNWQNETSEYQNAATTFEKFYHQNIKSSLTPNDQSNTPISHSKAYIDFIINTLKPFIDSSYNVLSDRTNTFIMGSSMGALVSIYAVQYAPQTFGTAIALSYPAINDYWAIQKRTWETYSTFSNQSRLYIDNGTGMLDSTFFPQFLEIEPMLRQNKWDDRHLLVRVFPNADHNEKAWMQRIHIPLLWAFLQEKEQ